MHTCIQEWQPYLTGQALEADFCQKVQLGQRYGQAGCRRQLQLVGSKRQRLQGCQLLE